MKPDDRIIITPARDTLIECLLLAPIVVGAIAALLGFPALMIWAALPALGMR